MFTGMFAKAQFAVHKMVHAGYVYQNQSFGELGGRLLFLENDDMIFRVRYDVCNHTATTPLICGCGL